MRYAETHRKTKETDIKMSLTLDGDKRGLEGSSGIGFFDHMLNSFAFHGGFHITLDMTGDLDVDGHHTVEDVGIALGQAVASAIGDKKGLTRYGSMILPMDEALVLCALDLSGRCGYYGELEIPTEKVGTFDTELVDEFFFAFSRNAAATLHFVQFAGNNSHHIIEGAFKAFARALKEAVKIDPECADEVPSTKGVL